MASIAIIGTGALGGFYGARMAQAGADVHFLCHRDGPWIREKGLLVESPGRWQIFLRANAYDRPEDMPRCDVVVIALKTTANRFLPAILPHVVKPDGCVVVMQNGFGVEEESAAAAPGVVVLGGLSFLCANKLEPGHVVHLDYGDVLLGWLKDAGAKTRADFWMNQYAGLLSAGHIHVKKTDDLSESRWRKLVWNIPYNGLSVLHRTTTDVLMADPAIRTRVQQLMREVQGLASACGHPIDDAFIDKMINDTIKMKPYKTSMLLDLELGRPLEIEAMYDRPLKAGEAAGASAPLIRELLGDLNRIAAKTTS